MTVVCVCKGKLWSKPRFSANLSTQQKSVDDVVSIEEGAQFDGYKGSDICDLNGVKKKKFGRSGTERSWSSRSDYALENSKRGMLPTAGQDDYEKKPTKKNRVKSHKNAKVEDNVAEMEVASRRARIGVPENVEPKSVAKKPKFVKGKKSKKHGTPKQ